MSLLYDLPPRLAALLFRGVIAKGPPGAVYLTFDDGPDPSQTPHFLQILRAMNCPATFFLTGSNVIDFPVVALQIAHANQGIGSHGFSHLSLLSASRVSARKEIAASVKAIEQATGVQPKLFRPPYGRIGPGVNAAAAELGMMTVLWSLSGADWKEKNSAALTARIVNRARDGDVILLHDAGKCAPVTLAALPDIINGIRAKGLQIAPLPVAKE